MEPTLNSCHHSDPAWLDLGASQRSGWRPKKLFKPSAPSRWQTLDASDASKNPTEIFPRNGKRPHDFPIGKRKMGRWVFGENLETSKKSHSFFQVKGFGVWHLCHENPPQDESAGCNPRRLGHQCTSEECSCNETCSKLVSPSCVEKSRKQSTNLGEQLATPSQDLNLFKDLAYHSHLWFSHHTFKKKTSIFTQNEVAQDFHPSDIHPSPRRDDKLLHL